MKFYHILWFYRLCFVVFFASMLAFALWWFNVLPDKAGDCALGVLICALLFRFLVDFWLSFRGGHRLGSPDSPDGLPVPPSGIWYDPDTPFAIGSRVLAPSHGQWYRGYVIKLKSRERAVIRFFGWDPFWDEIHRKSELQVEEEESMSAAEDQ